MEKKQFIKILKSFFEKKGFVCHKQHFYFDAQNDIVYVVGIDTVPGRDYVYIEQGFCFKSANINMPYPKFDHINILSDNRLRSSLGSTFRYVEYDEEIMNKILNEIEPSIDKAIDCSQSVDKLIKEYVLNGKSLINGIKTLQYLGIEKGNLKVTPGNV